MKGGIGMNCEEARMLIDAYIDGELSEEEKRALMDHAQACEMCAQELEAAELLRDTLAHMDDDVQVPIEAQAAWRSAVRAEAKKKNTKKWMRMTYAAAAALVLLIGAGVAFREMPKQQPQMMMARSVDAPVVANELIAKDGMAQNAVYTAGAGEDYSVWKKITSENPEQDLKALEMLAAEYNAGFEEQSEGICRIVLPQEYLDDFLNASSRIGKELSIEMMCDDTQTDYVIIFQFCEE